MQIDVTLFYSEYTHQYNPYTKSTQAFIRTGEVNMESFERITEQVTFIENIAVAMGNLTLNPTGEMPNAGKTVKRRYTNIWMKNNNGWQLVARQPTIISIT